MDQYAPQPHHYQQGACAFAAPPPREHYCRPAQFVANCGEKYLKITTAYGRSAVGPCNCV